MVTTTTTTTTTIATTVRPTTQIRHTTRGETRTGNDPATPDRKGWGPPDHKQQAASSQHKHNSQRATSGSRGHRTQKRRESRGERGDGDRSSSVQRASTGHPSPPARAYRRRRSQTAIPGSACTRHSAASPARLQRRTLQHTSTTAYQFASSPWPRAGVIQSMGSCLAPLSPLVALTRVSQ